MSSTLNALHVKGYAAHKAGAALTPYSFERREPREHDVVLDIMYCGICHTDIHQVRDEWGGSVYPMVPGHEIVGRISRIGTSVKRFKPGDFGGVGCFVDSCRSCPSCKQGVEQYCEKGATFTYNSKDKDGQTTKGGYSSQIVVDENYVLRVAAKQSLERIAPLLCAGITTYSPLKHWKVGPGQRIAVMGLGGLGHMAVKLGAAMGAEVTVLSSSSSKADDARRLGAAHFLATKDESTFKSQREHFDLIINTVSAPMEINPYLELLKRDGTMVLLGVPPEAHKVNPDLLIMKRRTLAGSVIGGIAETQDMLDFCTEKKIAADVEVIPMSKVNDAYERMMKGDVKYRFVIDMKSL